jgi:uncharacterized protein (DUF3084 family)
MNSELEINQNIETEEPKNPSRKRERKSVVQSDSVDVYLKTRAFQSMIDRQNKEIQQKAKKIIELENNISKKEILLQKNDKKISDLSENIEKIKAEFDKFREESSKKDKIIKEKEEEISRLTNKYVQDELFYSKKIFNK